MQFHAHELSNGGAGIPNFQRILAKVLPESEAQNAAHTRTAQTDTITSPSTLSIG